MGGSTKETNTTRRSRRRRSRHRSKGRNRRRSKATTPWAATSGLLGNLLNQIGGLSPNLTDAESGALGQLSANASAGNPWASQIGGVANTLLAGGGPDRTPMINDAYDQYRAALTPFARGDYVNPASDPALQSYLDVLKNDVSSQVNGMFAGAGRDLSGMNQQALARGIATGRGAGIARCLQPRSRRPAQRDRCALRRRAARRRDCCRISTRPGLRTSRPESAPPTPR